MSDNNIIYDEELIRKSIRRTLDDSKISDNNSKKSEILTDKARTMNVVDLVNDIRKNLPDENMHVDNHFTNNTFANSNVINVPNALIVNELLIGNSNEFLINAYRLILNRDPDPVGYNNYMGRLDKTHGNRINVLGSLRYSEEGRRNAVKINGLFPRYLWSRGKEIINKIPIVRCLFLFIVSLIKIAKRFEDIYGNIYRINSSLEKIESAFAQTDEKSNTNSQRIETLIENSSIGNGILNEKISESEKNIQSKLESELSELKNDINKEFNLLVEQYSEKVDKNVSDINTKLDSFIEQQSPINDDEISKVYMDFENKFRGTREEIQERLKLYISIIEKLDIENGHDNTTVLDIGCGRGEWIELLKNNRFRHVGVDSNSDMIKACNRLNLYALQSDALEYLQGLADESIHAVTGFHIVEHVGIEKLIYILKECKRVLKKKGVIIFETPNPENLIVGACNFYIDPTHKNPIPPMQLQFLAEQVGLVNIEIMRLHPYNAIEIQEAKLNEVKVAEEFKQMADFFNHSADYSIIAYKG